MKRLNNKGITTIEVIVSFVIVVIITASLYSTVSNYNQKRLIESYKSKIYTYKNTLTKEIQDDFIKIGLTHASYKNEHIGSSIVHTVNCDLRDGTKRTLIVTQRFTNSNYHVGDPSVDDYFMIEYGNEEADELLEYPLPNVGQSTTKEGNIAYDLSINNVLINIEDDNILSIYIGFYHPELMTRYGINIICPIDFVTKGVDSNGKFNVAEVTKATKKYSFHPNGGAGIINPIAATIGQPFDLPGKGLYVREGYTLTEWNTQSDGTGTSYALGEAIVPTQNQVKETVLYAQWDKVETKVFNYTKTIQTYTVTANGRYKLEVWGAAGGSPTSGINDNSHGGLGGYTKAEVNLKKDEVLYIVVGGKGSNNSPQGRVDSAYVDANVKEDGSINDIVKENGPKGGYNGGGDSAVGLSSGGGATHIAKVNGLLKDIYSSRDKVIIVAGGGGGGGVYTPGEGNGFGSSTDARGGSGGGTKGQNGYDSGVVMTGTNYTSYSGLGGTQDKGYAFGVGEGNETSVGAGGGWYGGYSSSEDYKGAGGGSGYINPSLIVSGSGKMFCFRCHSDSLTISTTNYIDNATFNTRKGKNCELPMEGDGRARISFISD